MTSENLFLRRVARPASGQEFFGQLRRRECRRLRITSRKLPALMCDFAVRRSGRCSPDLAGFKLLTYQSKDCKLESPSELLDFGLRSSEESCLGGSEVQRSLTWPASVLHLFLCSRRVKCNLKAAPKQAQDSGRPNMIRPTKRKQIGAHHQKKELACSYAEEKS